MTQNQFIRLNMINIALYQPDIPQNTAAIIRLCSCLGANLEIIEPCGFRLDDIKIKRIAMDYLENCKIIRHKSIQEFFEIKKKSRIILMTTKANKMYHTFNFKNKDTILFGRESKGVPKFIHKKSFKNLKIPMLKNARSLNIATSAAITLSEALRQTEFIDD